MNFSIPIYIEPDSRLQQDLIQRPKLPAVDLDTKIDQIFREIIEEGDAALYRMTAKFDQVSISNLELKEYALYALSSSVEPDLMEAIDIAFDNIFRFHQRQMTDESKIVTSIGVECWRRSSPIEKVGIYIPGGSAPLFSTVLMLGIPALIAGCKDIILCTPPNKEGTIHPAIAYCALKCGIKKVFTIGGAQAIAAMTVGTESIPRVFKIFGPGNQYVTTAKMKAVEYGVAIDMPAGPSEVLVYADDDCDPEFVAVDLLSQAEHGPDSQVVVVCRTREMAHNIEHAIAWSVETLERKTIIDKALQNALLIVFSDTVEAFAFINLYAPEHLIIASDRALELASLVKSAGSVFLGHFTPESAGDYASGTNHTLPTAAFAKNHSGVSVDSFVKKITFQSISTEGLQNIGPTIMTMAHAEKLTAHALAVDIRLKKLNQ